MGVISRIAPKDYHYVALPGLSLRVKATQSYRLVLPHLVRGYGERHPLIPEHAGDRKDHLVCSSGFIDDDAARTSRYMLSHEPTEIASRDDSISPIHIHGTGRYQDVQTVRYGWDRRTSGVCCRYLGRPGLSVSSDRTETSPFHPHKKAARMPRTITTQTIAYTMDELMSESQSGYWAALSCVEDEYMECTWPLLLENVIDNVRDESQQAGFIPIMDITGSYWLPSGRLKLPPGMSPSWADLPPTGYRAADGESYFYELPASNLAVINDLADELLESFVMEYDRVMAVVTDTQALHAYAVEQGYLFDTFGRFQGTDDDS